MNIKDLRQNKYLSHLFVIHDKIMSSLGLFRLKAKIKYFFFCNRLIIEDYIKKKKIEKEIYNMPDRIINPKLENDEIVVSLTSYGKRVTDTLPYMLYSLLVQTQLPKKVVVFLDKDNWNERKLPKILKKIARIGIEFVYCEDLKSYKKLIPALKMFPNNPILIFDDDFYYNPNSIEWMTKAYEMSDKRTVIGTWGCIPEQKDGKYLPYNEWKDCKLGDGNSPISFKSGYGTLFPPNVFDDEIMNDKVFMKLSPTADDIWFWIMMERQSVSRMYLGNYGYGIHVPINRVAAYEIASDECLTVTNVINGQNNKQCADLLRYYNLN